MSAETERDAEFMRQAIDAARRGAALGNRPYGALLVAADGQVLGEGHNTERSDGDLTGHAETNVLRDVVRARGSGPLAGATIYASGELCPMCAAVTFYSGVSRVVYGISRERARELSPQSRDAPTLGVSCRDILATSSRPIEVIGPFLEDEVEPIFVENAGR
jgi:tRNA(Arg) A34 adenosine deaminase TadA